jgi:FAD/FMN-containing dehydrogenase
MFPLGGALIDNDGKYPIPWRNAPWAAHPLGVWPNAADDARAIQWVRDTRTDMAPWAIDAVYLNFIGEEGGAREIAGYGRDNYARLAQVKRQYDPDNVFHLNNNIRPA